MSGLDMEKLIEAIKKHWPATTNEKVQGYVGKFFSATRLGTKVSAQVVGNHGTYTVSIEADEQSIFSACSCYIGKDGYCHHCHALALTFLNNPDVFVELKTRALHEVERLSDLEEYLRGATLDTLIGELRASGITQKAFAEALGTNSRHLSTIKSSERRNRYHGELGATKLACLWVLDRFKKNKGQ